MANTARRSGPVLHSPGTMQPPSGTVRRCVAYRGELLRHRIITADGLDYVVVTEQSFSIRRPFVTAAYPLSHGYVVMMRQPLCAIRSTDERAALTHHEQLVRVLAEAGVQVVRARRLLEARRHAEQAEARRESPRRAFDDSGVILAVLESPTR